MTSNELAEVVPSANLEAGSIALGHMLGELAKHIAQNKIVKAHSRDLAQAAAQHQANHQKAVAVVEVVRDALTRVVGNSAGEKPANFETLCDRVADLSMTVRGVQVLVASGVMPDALPQDEDLNHLLRLVRDGLLAADESAHPAIETVSMEWGHVSRLKAALGHLKGGRIPTGISVLESVIDDLCEELHPAHKGCDLAEATAADRKIKENKEDCEPAM